MMPLGFLLAEDSSVSQLETLLNQSQVNNWLNDAKQFVTERAVDLGLRLAAAGILYMVGRWVVAIAVRLAKKGLERAKMDPMLVGFAGNVLHAVLTTLVIIGSLQLLGIEMTSLTAMIAAAGFAIGLALQGSLSNFASGLLLVIFKPFRVGDKVDAGGTTGRVEEIHLFTTILRTSDNAQIIVPNGQITSGTITNFSAFPTRRIDLIIGCGYADDLKAVKAFLQKLIKNHPRVLQDPEPVVMVADLAESSVNFHVRPWVRTEDYGLVRSELLEAIKLGFDEQGFTIPFPSHDVYVQGTTTSLVMPGRSAA